MRLIDADALIAEIVKTTTFVKDNVLFQKMVDEAPTVSADRPTGEWLMFDGLYCSNCHYKLQTTGIPTYCPSCGARMVKGGAE